MSGKSGKLKTVFIWVVLIVAFVWLIRLGHEPAAQPTSFAMFHELAATGRVNEVWRDGNQIVFECDDSSRRMSTTGVIDADLEKKLSEEGVPFHYGKPQSASVLGSAWSPLIVCLFVVVFAVLIYRYLAKRRDGSFGMFSLRKTRAVLIDDRRKVSFADIGGCDEAKRSLADLVDFLKNPSRWTDAGARLPRGVLLDGPPGCGKTLLARAVAGETNAKFYVVSASEFVELFVGVGAARVRDTFESAAKDAPAIIFIDELDAIGRRRGAGIDIGHNEREQTLNQLLVCLDGVKLHDRVVVLAATNRSDVLDKALLRPGRFDRILHVPPLSREARLAVIQIHSRGKPLGADVALPELADSTEGLNGAHLESLVNEATLLAVRRGRDTRSESVEVTQADFQTALESIRPAHSQFDMLDEVLIDAASQLSKPTGKTLARLTLADGATFEGEVLWVNAAFIKIHGADDDSPSIIPKRHIVRLEALDGTGQIDAAEIAADPWANRVPETM